MGVPFLGVPFLLFVQSLAADGVGLRGKESTLIVVEEQSLPAQRVEQSFDVSVLELDDLLLPAVDDATEYGEQNLPGGEQYRHIRRRTRPVSDAER